MIPRALWLALALIVPISPANAHDAIAGGGPFVNGILHPVITPAHLLSLLALGLWIGRQERAALRRSIVGFAVALIAGLFASPLGTLPPLVPIACAVILGCLAGGGWPWPPRLAGLISVATAIVIGFDGGADVWALALGIWLGAMLILLNVVNLAMRIEAAWLRIGVRIAGAWIAAIALLLLALSLRA